MRRVLVGLAVLSSLVAGCGTSEQLQALKDDPIAHYEPPGGKLVDAHGMSEGNPLGKPRRASFRRLFEVPPGDPVKQLQAVLDAAAAAGWTVGEAGPDSQFLEQFIETGTKRLPTGGARLSVTVFPSGTPSGRTAGAPALLILLEHR